MVDPTADPVWVEPTDAELDAAANDLIGGCPPSRLSPDCLSCFFATSPDQLENPKLSFLFSYWQKHTDPQTGRQTRAEFDMLTLLPAVGNIMILDVLREGFDARYRLYGTGVADPLRSDPTLRSLEGKSARALVVAAMHGVALVNLSTAPVSRLVWPRAMPGTAAAARPAPYDAGAAAEALAEEARLDYRVPSGRYWKEADRFDTSALDALDALWLRAARVPAPQPATLREAV